MQELHAVRKEPNRQNEATAPQREILRNDIADLVDDLREIDYLIENLGIAQFDFSADAKSDEAFHSGTFVEVFNNQVRLLKTRQTALLDLVERATRWSNSADLRILVRQIRKDCLHLKSEIRIAYRHRGLILCSTDWQSPLYASTFKLELNRFNDPIKEHAWDYKRDGHLDAIIYEEAFVKTYLPNSGSTKCKAYLTNSGMVAIPLFFTGSRTKLIWATTHWRCNRCISKTSTLHASSSPAFAQSENTVRKSFSTH